MLRDSEWYCINRKQCHNKLKVIIVIIFIKHALSSTLMEEKIPHKISNPSCGASRDILPSLYFQKSRPPLMLIRGLIHIIMLRISSFVLFIHEETCIIIYPINTYSHPFFWEGGVKGPAADATDTLQP
jgi:hypothetical protein